MAVIYNRTIVLLMFTNFVLLLQLCTCTQNAKDVGESSKHLHNHHQYKYYGRLMDRVLIFHTCIAKPLIAKCEKDFAERIKNASEDESPKEKKSCETIKHMNALILKLIHLYTEKTEENMGEINKYLDEIVDIMVKYTVSVLRHLSNSIKSTNGKIAEIIAIELIMKTTRMNKEEQQSANNIDNSGSRSVLLPPTDSVVRNNQIAVKLEAHFKAKYNDLLQIQSSSVPFAISEQQRTLAYDCVHTSNAMLELYKRYGPCMATFWALDQFVVNLRVLNAMTNWASNDEADNILDCWPFTILHL